MKNEKKSAGKNQWKPVISFFLKLLLAAGIVWFLLTKNFDGVQEGFRNFDYRWLIPAAVLYFFHMFVCGVRWYYLTKVLRIDITWSEAVSLTMQCYFFSLVMPGGALGGDIIKIGVLSARVPDGTRIEGAFSILMDRIVGMIAMFGTILAILPWAAPLLLRVEIPGVEIPQFWKIAGIIGVALLCLAGIGASFAIFFHRTLAKIPPCGWLMDLGDRITHGAVKRMTDAADLYRTAPGIMFQSIFWSVPLVHLMTAVVFGCLAMGLGAPGATVLSVVTAVMLGNLAGLLPLSPSGIGVRDVTVIAVMVAGGMQMADAQTVQLLYTALLVAASMLCGVFFLFDPGRRKKQELLRKIAEGEMAG